MSLSINQCCIAGNLARDAEHKTSQSGVNICKFSVAVSNRKKVNGDWANGADFFDVVLFGNLGAKFGEQNSLQKGTPVVVSGRLQLEQWESQDGGKRSKVSIIADTVIPYGRSNSAPQIDKNVAMIQNTFSGQEVPF